MYPLWSHPHRSLNQWMATNDCRFPHCPCNIVLLLYSKPIRVVGASLDGVEMRAIQYMTILGASHQRPRQPLITATLFLGIVQKDAAEASPADVYCSFNSCLSPKAGLTCVLNMGGVIRVCFYVPLATRSRGCY